MTVSNLQGVRDSLPDLAGSAQPSSQPDLGDLCAVVTAQVRVVEFAISDQNLQCNKFVE